MKLPKRAGERRSVSERTCLELLVILAAIIIGEVVWLVVFTWIALWLRRF